MGICSSVERRKESDSDLNIEYGISGEDVEVESFEIYDMKAIADLKKSLNDCPKDFLLNAILMSILFFGNHDKDHYDISNKEVPIQEKELNVLLKAECRKCVLPDVTINKLDKNFELINGLGKKTTFPKTIYVLDEKIEVVNKDDNGFYTHVDKSNLVILAEEAKKKPGFLRMVVPEDTNDSAKTTNYIESKLADSEPEEVDEDQYFEVTNFKTPKRLTIVEKSNRVDNLSNNCIEIRKVPTVEKTDDDSSDEDDFNESGDARHENLYKTISFLNSKQYMLHFQNEIFPNALGKILGFQQSEIYQAEAIPGIIFCNEIVQPDKIRSCKIIPALAVDWPKQAFEYEKRASRTTINDNRKGIKYVWPSDDMLSEVIKFECVVVPRGLVMKKQENPDSNIEWEIQFPKAERYLETKLPHTPLRCFVFLWLLHNTFIDPKTHNHGLLVEHYRTHIFWECESNARDWPEHKLGTKLLNVIAHLNSGLSRGLLPNYFIKKKNCLQNIPSSYLQGTQETFHKIIEFPVHHCLKAFRRLNTLSKDSYPLIDIEKLEDILNKRDDELLSQIEQRKRSSHYPNEKKNSTYTSGDTLVKGLSWKVENEKENRKIYLEKQQQKIKRELDKKKNIILRDKEEEFSLKWKNDKLNKIKQVAILKFFIEHFIDIIRKSNAIGPKHQTLLYSKQAWYFSKLLEDIAGAQSDAQEYIRIIHREEAICEKTQKRSDIDLGPPSTPVRNSVQFRFSTSSQMKPFATPPTIPESNYEHYHPRSLPSIPKDTEAKSLTKSKSMKKTVVFR